MYSFREREFRQTEVSKTAQKTIHIADLVLALCFLYKSFLYIRRNDEKQF